MGFELDIDRELGTISATLVELSSIHSTISSMVRDEEFNRHYNAIIEEFAKSYHIVGDNLIGFTQIQSEEDFTANFDALHAAYTDCYLMEISKPRTCGEAMYEPFQLIRMTKQFKTEYPLLKRAFERLDHFYDKWVDNDAWLSMSIDHMFKRVKNLLTEIDGLKKKDPEDAFLVYQAAFGAFAVFLDLIRPKAEALSPQRYTEDQKQKAADSLLG